MEELAGRVGLGDARRPSPETSADANRELSPSASEIAGRSTPRRTSRSGSSPFVDQLLGRCQLSGEDELDIGSQHGVLGQRLRVVRRSAVDERRRHEHDLIGAEPVGGGERRRHEGARTLALLGSSVVVAGAEVDHHVGGRHPCRDVPASAPVDVDATVSSSTTTSIGPAVGSCSSGSPSSRATRAPERAVRSGQHRSRHRGGRYRWGTQCS